MRKQLLLAFVALALSTIVVSCAPPLTTEEEPTPTPLPTPVIPEKPVYEVKRGEVVNSVDFLCRVAPVREVQLFFKMNGRVAKVYVEKGDMVKEGDLLAELEVQDIMNRADQARVDLEKAQLALEQAKTALADQLTAARNNLEIAKVRLAQAEAEQAYAIAQAELNLSNATIRLQQAQNQDPQSALRQAEANLRKAEADLQAAQVRYSEDVNDPEKSASALQAYQEAIANYELAQAQYEEAKRGVNDAAYNIQLLQNQVEEARLALERAKAGVDPLLQKNVEAAEREVQRLESGVDPLLEKNVQTAQLVLDNVLAQVDSAQIVAPFDGEVLGVLVFEGREATAYKPVITVAEPGNIELSCDLTSSVLEKLAEGMEAGIVFSDFPGERLTGKVRQLPYPYGAGGSSKTTTAEAEDKSTRISIDDTKGRELEIGQLAKVNVVLERKADVLYLPIAAVRTFEGRRFVVIQDSDGRQRRVDVKIGITSTADDRVEIIEGVEEGQVVVGP